MVTNNNQMIARQLQALAAGLPGMADEDLLPAILDACSGLLAEVQKRRPAVEALDQVDLAQFMGGYTDISGHVGRFAGEIERSLGVEYTARQLTDSMKNLEQLKQKHAQDTLALRSLEHQIAHQTQTNNILKQSVSQSKAQMDTLTNFHNGLLSMQAACSPAAISKQQADNAALLLQVNRQQANLDNLQKEHKELDNQLNHLQQQIGTVQTAIDALPAENARLLADYDAKKTRLDRLQKAQVDCSPEKQQELEAQIAKLTPLTDDLQQKMAQLQNHHDRLSDARTELDRQNQILETNLLTLLSESMGELNLLMTEHRSDLAAIKKEADAYTESLSECRKIRQGYADWCGCNRDQLDAMLKALDQRESMELSKTLDVSRQNRIRLLFNQVEDSLKEMDRILKECAAAARADLSDIERKAGTR